MGKAVSFMVFLWVMVSLGGGVYMNSSMVFATTRLTAPVSLTESDSIYVQSTNGFADSGIISIDNEQIGYATKTANTFNRLSVVGLTVPTQPIVRAANGTTAATHTIGALVRTPESNMMNQAINYKLAVLSDSSGLMAFVTVSMTLVSLLASFLVLPISFLGSDLQVLTYLWGALCIGIIVSLWISLAGGRKTS